MRKREKGGILNLLYVICKLLAFEIVSVSSIITVIPDDHMYESHLPRYKLHHGINPFLPKIKTKSTRSFWMATIRQPTAISCMLMVKIVRLYGLD